MKLLYQTHSPFARKVLVFAHEAHLAHSIEVIHHETSPTNRNEEVYDLNPLGKVPVLITDDNQILFDSTVICKFLDQLSRNENLIPINENSALNALKLQALADGLSETGILARWESVRRPEKLRYQPLFDGLKDKLEAGYTYLENEMNFEEPIHIGHIALATSLSWLEFRDLITLSNKHPKLTQWYRIFLRRPSMRATELSGDTVDR